jgi:hypothetical protein
VKAARTKKGENIRPLKETKCGFQRALPFREDPDEARSSLPLLLSPLSALSSSCWSSVPVLSAMELLLKENEARNQK